MKNVIEGLAIVVTVYSLCALALGYSAWFLVPAFVGLAIVEFI